MSPDKRIPERDKRYHFPRCRPVHHKAWQRPDGSIYWVCPDPRSEAEKQAAARLDREDEAARLHYERLELERRNP